MSTTGTRGRVGRPRKHLDAPIETDLMGTKLPSCNGETVEQSWLSQDCKQIFYFLKSKLKEKGIDKNEFSIPLNRWANAMGEYIKVKAEADKTPYIMQSTGGRQTVHPIHTLLIKKALELDGCCRMFGFTPDSMNKLVIPKTHFGEDNEFDEF